jgi:chromosome segregation ATPase
MGWLVERRLTDVSARLRTARTELTVLDEQLAVVTDEADDLRIRSLTSETPQASEDHTMGQRHVDALQRARADLTRRISDLERRRDDLLDRLSAQARR